MRNSFLLLSLFWVLQASATGGEYAVGAIPDSVLKGANVVKRMELIRYTVGENNKASLYHKVAYTILNEQGDRWAYFAVGYDPMRSIESFDGNLYDAQGIKLKSLKKSEVGDVSRSGGDAFANDDRIRFHSFYYKAYPYTVEYESTVNYKGTMFVPDWMPQERPVMGVQNSLIQVIVPVSNPLHYKMFHYAGEPRISDIKEGRQYEWEVKNMKPVESEYRAPDWSKLTTFVALTTETFMLGDYKGSNASWNDFGKFVYDLKRDRDKLPDDVKQKVHELTDGLSDRYEKIKVLYEFMQQHTRYVGIQLGIGGWQPYDAQYVASKQYGDCKALSNYMYSLLKEAGIRSVYTVITYGDDPDYLITDLPSSQFNHAVLFVPGDKDTIWLECTSQTLSPGYVNHISNRYALAVDENGGKLVRTPVYGISENQEIRHETAEMDAEGNLELKAQTRYQGSRQDEIHDLNAGLTKDKIMEYLKNNLELATYDVKSFHYEEIKGRLPVMTEALDLTVDNYGSITGKRLFVVPNILERSTLKLKDDENRRNELIIEESSLVVDTVDMKLPSGYTAESVPAPVNLVTPYGKYNAQVTFTAEKMQYIRRLESVAGHYPATEYAAVKKFYDAVYKADRAKLVLVKKDQ